MRPNYTLFVLLFVFSGNVNAHAQWVPTRHRQPQTVTQISQSQSSGEQNASLPSTYLNESAINPNGDRNAWVTQSDGGFQVLYVEEPRCDFIPFPLATDDHEGITSLIKDALAEHLDLLEAGCCDGTGLLYQSTPSYMLLASYCSAEELEELHQIFSPAAAYRPAQPVRLGSCDKAELQILFSRCKLRMYQEPPQQSLEKLNDLQDLAR